MDEKKTKKVTVSKTKSTKVVDSVKEDSSVVKTKANVARSKKATIGLKNKKEATKALSKNKNVKTKKVTQKKKDPLKNINIVRKIEPVKEEKEKKVVVKKPKKAAAKKEEKTKLVLPKEWTVQNKPKKQVKKHKEFTNTNTLTNIFKNKLFEEVDEKEYQEEKKEKKEKRKKILIILGIVVAVLLIGGLILIKVNSSFKKQLALYDPYSIGQKITLKDDSIWYVVEDSGKNSDEVKILKETTIDIDGDNKITDKDKMKYNEEDKAEYNLTLKESGPYYLDNSYKKILEEKVGSVESIGMLTTKEFIKIRDRMGYSDEWSDGNWLANKSLGNWWIESVQNQKVFAVSPNGSFKLFYAKSYNYLRPTIVIKKEKIKVIKEETPKEENKTENEKKD